jgi:hypothetical protein
MRSHNASSSNYPNSLQTAIALCCFSQHLGIAAVSSLYAGHIDYVEHSAISPEPLLTK